MYWTQVDGLQGPNHNPHCLLPKKQLPVEHKEAISLTSGGNQSPSGKYVIKIWETKLERRLSVDCSGQLALNSTVLNFSFQGVAIKLTSVLWVKNSTKVDKSHSLVQLLLSTATYNREPKGEDQALVALKHVTFLHLENVVSPYQRAHCVTRTRGGMIIMT